jgi:hypothetical protein
MRTRAGPSRPVFLCPEGGRREEKNPNVFQVLAKNINLFSNKL